MLITLGGKAGSGKGTISKLLAQHLNYQIISIGSLKRQLAEEMHLSISEFNALGDLPKNQQEFDLKYEEYQKKLALNENIILESRLGFFCQPHAFKVFLDVQDEIASERILGDKRSTDSYDNANSALEATKTRNLKDQERYQKLYNINLRDPAHYDCFIDTSSLTPDQVCEKILKAFEAFKQEKKPE